MTAEETFKALKAPVKGTCFTCVYGMEQKDVIEHCVPCGYNGPGDYSNWKWKWKGIK